jgi:cell division protein FtsQ
MSMSLAALRARNFLREPLKPRWYWPVVHASGIGAGLLFGLGIGIWFGSSGMAYDATSSVTERVLGVTSNAGLAVRQVYAEGRERTDLELLNRQLGIAIGEPILGIDTGAVKARLEALPWVREAAVGRLLPDTIKVRLVEHRPLALWQNQGSFSLIDRDGAVIVSGVSVQEIAADYSYLRVLVGDNAPTHAARLFRMLSTEPELSARVVAATWIGDRRWTHRFDNKVDELLPEAAPDAAWRLLARKAEEDALHDRAVKVIVLRQLPERIRLRLDSGDGEGTEA